MAETPWSRRPLDWLGRRFARGAARLRAEQRRRAGVDPVSWTPNPVARRRYPRCRKPDRRTRRRSDSRWSNWFGPAVRPETWLGSSNRRPRPSGPGLLRPTATPARAPTACAPKSVKRYGSYAGRSGGCAKSGTYSQKRRPGSRGRPDPGGLPVHEREPGPFLRRHDGPCARCLPERVLRVASTSTLGSCAGRFGADGPRAGDSCQQPGHVRRAADSRRTGRSRRRGPRTTRREVRDRPAPDRVERRFEADVPNRLWVADITYIPTLAGFLYLAIVLDVFSRRVVGWAMAAHLRTELVVEALEMAVAQRRPAAIIHHSDRGCQYTSLAFGARCREWDVALSMGSVGDCFDNAMAESFFATLECELLDRTTLSTHAEARAAVFEFVEGWYNTRRRHSAGLRLAARVRTSAGGRPRGRLSGAHESVGARVAGADSRRHRRSSGNTRRKRWPTDARLAFGFASRIAAARPAGSSRKRTRACWAAELLSAPLVAKTVAALPDCAAYSHGALWKCPACGRPVGVVLNLKVG